MYLDPQPDHFSLRLNKRKERGFNLLMAPIEQSSIITTDKVPIKMRLRISFIIEQIFEIEVQIISMVMPISAFKLSHQEIEIIKTTMCLLWKQLFVLQIHQEVNQNLPSNLRRIMLGLQAASVGLHLQEVVHK